MHRQILLSGTLVTLGMIGLWEFLVRIFEVPSYLLPLPSAVIVEIMERSSLYANAALSTLWGVLLGFLLAGVLGILLGTAIVYSWLMRSTLYPLVLVFQVIPKIAIAPILIIWVGYGIELKATVAMVIALFPVVISTVVGLNSVERELLDLVRVLGGSRFKEFVKISFPHAMPFIFSGLKVSITFAVIGAVVAEFITGNTGLGYLIIVANTEVNTSMAFAALICLSAIGIILFAAAAGMEKLIVPWQPERESTNFTT